MAKGVSKKKDDRSESFFDKMKSDKKYNAKVQLIGYGIFIVVLVLYVNLASMGNRGSSNLNSVMDNFDNLNSGNNITDEDKGLLKSLSNNYNYDITINVTKKSINLDTNEEMEVDSSIRYLGKSYGNKLEINKSFNDVNGVYYRVDNNYYSKVDNITSFVKEDVIYDVIDSDYIEVSNILGLINKASLDYVTEYSSGKKESLYNLSVKDIVLSHKEADVVSISVIEENEVLTLRIDYSNLFKVIYDDIVRCELVASISNIGKVEEFNLEVNEG